MAGRERLCPVVIVRLLLPRATADPSTVHETYQLMGRALDCLYPWRYPTRGGWRLRAPPAFHQVVERAHPITRTGGVA